VTKPVVLVFVRPYLVNDFRRMTAPLEGSFSFRFFTDGHCPGTEDHRAAFYRLVDSPNCPNILTEEEEAQVTQRCRYLRNLPNPLALRICRAMAVVLSEKIQDIGPAVVLSHWVDEYANHILSLLAKKSQVRHISFAASFFSQYVQFLVGSSGRPFRFRSVDLAEAQRVIETVMKPRFRQNYGIREDYSFFRHLKQIARYRVKQVVFFVRSRIERDALRMHYACLPFIAERRRISDFPTEALFHSDWHRRIGDAKGAGRKVVFVPLAYFPECSTDYWMDDLSILAYEKTLLSICNALSSQYHVVVKEHLHMLGCRSCQFLEALSQLENVSSVPPMAYSNDVINEVDAVIVGAGSIGIEATVRGKPLLTYCPNSYWFNPAVNGILNVSEISDWPEQIHSHLASHSAGSHQAPQHFVASCLESSGGATDGGSVWPHCKPEHLQQALTVALTN
jgi:hypothetical protein